MAVVEIGRAKIAAQGADVRRRPAAVSNQHFVTHSWPPAEESHKGSPHIAPRICTYLGAGKQWHNESDGRPAPPDYRPNMVFSRLDSVPDYFRSIGWM